MKIELRLGTDDRQNVLAEDFLNRFGSRVEVSQKKSDGSNQDPILVRVSDGRELRGFRQIKDCLRFWFI